MTLIDSRRAILASFAGVAADTGVAIDPAGVTSRLGIKLEAELAYWFPPGEIAEAVRVYRAHYLRLAAPLTSPLPGAAEALAAVRAAGAPTVVITAKYELTARLSLEGVGLSADELFADAHGPEKAAILKDDRRGRLRRRHPGGHGRGGHRGGARRGRYHGLLHRRRPTRGRRGGRAPLADGFPSSVPQNNYLRVLGLRAAVALRTRCGAAARPA